MFVDICQAKCSNPSGRKCFDARKVIREAGTKFSDAVKCHYSKRVRLLASPLQCQQFELSANYRCWMADREINTNETLKSFGALFLWYTPAASERRVSAISTRVTESHGFFIEHLLHCCEWQRVLVEFTRCREFL